MIRMLDRMDDTLYRQESNYFENGSIGKHFRHIINFYDELLDAYQSGELCYENRKRESVYEEFPKVAARRLREIIDLIPKLKDKELKLIYDGYEDHISIISTTYFREIHHNLGHVTHHLAIVKIYLQQLDASFILDKDFGYAFSTIKNKELN